MNSNSSSAKRNFDSYSEGYDNIYRSNRIGENMKLLAEAYGYSKCKLTLRNGATCVGSAWDYHEAENDNGDELGYYLLDFRLDSGEMLFFREEDVVGVEEIIE